RGDRAPGRRPVRGRPAQDAIGEDHAPSSPGRGRRACPGRHHDARRPGRRRPAQGGVRRAGGLRRTRRRPVTRSLSDPYCSTRPGTLPWCAPPAATPGASRTSHMGGSMCSRSLLSRGGLAGRVALLLSVAPAAVAPATASVTARGTDDAGAALPGAQVIATDGLTGLHLGAFTQTDGRYTISGLRAGATYTVQVRMIGYGATSATGIVLSAGETRTLDFTLGSQAIGLDAIEVFL